MQKPKSMSTERDITLPLTDAKYSCPFCSRRSCRVKWFTMPIFVYGYISIPPIVEPESFLNH